MKKSELKKIIKEEILQLDEAHDIVSKGFVPLRAICKTNGKGYWTDKKIQMKVTGMNFEIIDQGNDKYYAHLKMMFDPKQVQVSKEDKPWTSNDLVYTDEQWLTDMRAYLKGFASGNNGLARKYGIPELVLQKIDYTEQGMQGKNFVSLETPSWTGKKKQ